MATLTATCPHCAVASQYDARYAGFLVPCSGCGRDIELPAPGKQRPGESLGAAIQNLEGLYQLGDTADKLKDPKNCFVRQRSTLRDYVRSVIRAERAEREATARFHQTHERIDAVIGDVRNHHRLAKGALFGIARFFPAPAATRPRHSNATEELVRELEAAALAFKRRHTELMAWVAAFVPMLLGAGVLVVLALGLTSRLQQITAIIIGAGAFIVIMWAYILLVARKFHSEVAAYNHAEFLCDRCNEASARQHDADFVQIRRAYTASLDSIQKSQRAIRQHVDRIVPSWSNATAWAAWRCRGALPPLLRVGDLTTWPADTDSPSTHAGCDIKWHEDGKKLAVCAPWSDGKGPVEMPAILPFPFGQPVLLEVAGEYKKGSTRYHQQPCAADPCTRTPWKGGVHPYRSRRSR